MPPYMTRAPSVKMIAHYDGYNGNFEVDLWEEGKLFILNLTHEYGYELDRWITLSEKSAEEHAAGNNRCAAQSTDCGGRWRRAERAADIADQGVGVLQKQCLR